MLIALYLAASVIVGWLGRYKQIGFAGFFLVSLLLTPIIALIILIISHDRRSQVSS